MTTEHAFWLLVLAGFGAWALWQLCVWVGGKLATWIWGEGRPR